MCKSHQYCSIAEHVRQSEGRACWRASLAMLTNHLYSDPLLVTLGGAIPLIEGLAIASEGLGDYGSGLNWASEDPRVIRGFLNLGLSPLLHALKLGYTQRIMVMLINLLLQMNKPFMLALRDHWIVVGSRFDDPADYSQTLLHIHDPLESGPTIISCGPLLKLVGKIEPETIVVKKTDADAILPYRDQLRASLVMP